MYAIPKRPNDTPTASQRILDGGAESLSAALARLSQLASNNTRRAEAIAADQAMTDDEKRAALSALALDAQVAAEQALADVADSYAAASDHDYRAAFVTTGTDAAAIIAARDASDRAAAIDSDAERLDAMNRAVRLGDLGLASALAAEALDAGDGRSIDVYVLARPQVQAAVERLWQARATRGQSSWTLAAAVLDATTVPTELSVGPSH